MRTNSIKTALAGWLILLSLPGQGQPKILTYGDYLKCVRDSNVSFIAERLTVSIAQAKERAARVFPDPGVAFSYTNNQEQTLQMGLSYEGELTYELGLGGKRKARMNVASSEKEIAVAMTDDYFRNLRADATLYYLNALKEKELLRLMKSSHEKMAKLASGDSIRFRLGQLAEVDALQSKLEAQTLHNEVLKGEAGYKNALTDLSHLMGYTQFAVIDSISGELQSVVHLYSLDELIQTAGANRADLQAIIKSRDLSARSLRLTRAERTMDVGLNLGYAYNTVVRNEIAPAPAFNGITAGISIPLKFSNLNKGEIAAGEYAVQQSAYRYEAALQQIRKEVTQALELYRQSCNKTAMYEKNLLADADSILDKKLYSYRRGETSLLEYLNAQRTNIEVHQSYIEALAECLSSLVEVQRAAGIWDFRM